MKKILRMIVLFLAAVLMSLGITAVIYGTAALRSKPWQSEISVEQMASQLNETDGSWQLSDQASEQLEQANAWCILLDETGNVIYEENRPEEVPLHYTAAETASFSRWYLKDYPVMSWSRDGNLLVIGLPKDSYVRFNLVYSYPSVKMLMKLFPAVCLILIAVLVFFGRRTYRSEQAKKDLARARWIDGISHDIRTPLSVMMGYAGEWQEDRALPDKERQEAGRMVSACTRIKTLVSDLNLTMRLDYEMQPLRRTSISPETLLRSSAANALNSGVLQDVEIRLPESDSGLRVQADAVLIERALYNLLSNAAGHGTSAAAAVWIEIGRNSCTWCVESSCADAEKTAMELNDRRSWKPQEISRDGTAAHGTGLYLVRQIARVHHGHLKFASAEGKLTARMCIRNK